MSKLIKILDKIINLTVVIVFIVILFLGAYALFDAYSVYNDANLPSNIAKFRPSESDEFSLSGLQEINSDICGWLRIDNTNIDYPLVQGKDNSEYLNTNYNKEYSVAGSIFLDYRNNRNFKDDYTIIYGHNMKSDQMFADVKNFSDKSYFDSHTTGKIYTSEGIYDIQIYCYAKISAYSNIAYNLTSYANKKNNEIVNYYSREASNIRNLDVENKKLIMLSTCDVSDANVRSVLVATIEDFSENKDSVIVKEKNNNTNIEKQNTDSFVSKSTKRVISQKAISFIIIIIILVLILIIEMLILKGKKQKNHKNNKTKNIEVSSINKAIKNKEKQNKNGKYKTKTKKNYKSKHKGKHF